MSHDCEHHHELGHHHHHHHGAGNIRNAFFLNLAFTIIELIGGVMTNSVAILSDALHDLGDSLSLGVAWYLEKYSDKKRDQHYSYGYQRFSLLGALINIVILLLGSAFILFAAIPRLFNPAEVNAGGMIGLAILGVIFNGAAMFQMKKGEGLNQKMVTLHLLEDVLGWVAVLIGSILIYFFDWPIIDPILSILIACFIIYNVIKGMRQALRILLQGTPVSVNVQGVERILNDFAEIANVHDTHLWTMDGQYNVLTVHVVLKQNKDLQSLIALKQKIRSSLKTLKIQHVTIEFEQEGEPCELMDG